MRIVIPLGLEKADYTLSSGKQVRRIRRCLWLHVYKPVEKPWTYPHRGVNIRWGYRP